LLRHLAFIPPRIGAHASTSRRVGMDRRVKRGGDEAA